MCWAVCTDHFPLLYPAKPQPLLLPLMAEPVIPHQPWLPFSLWSWRHLFLAVFLTCLEPCLLSTAQEAGHLPSVSRGLCNGQTPHVPSHLLKCPDTSADGVQLELQGAVASLNPRLCPPVCL